MGEQYITMTNDCSDYVYVDAKDIICVTGGLKPHADAIKWYNPPSKYAEYFNEFHEYDRMDLSDGKANNDEVLDDGKYNPGYRYIIYSRLKNTTVKVRPSQVKDVIVRVYNATKNSLMPASVLRQMMAREIAMHLNNLSITNVVCSLEDINDVITLEDIFAVSDAIDPIEHDILKNEIKLYVFDPNLIHYASDEKKFKAFQDIKNRLETGFYRKKINFLDMLRWDKNMEPKERAMYLRCGVMPEDGEEPERTYDRVKMKLELLEKQDKAFKISKWCPTTRFCPKCGCLNTLTLKDKIYVCDCGYTEDRDVHASKNVKLFGSTKRTECLEQASAEASVTTQSIVSQLVMQIESVKRKQEATTL